MTDAVQVPGPALEDRRDFWTTFNRAFGRLMPSLGRRSSTPRSDAHRCTLEPAIREIARFGEWPGRDVLELGCGIATDGMQFVRAGARSTGMDLSPTALGLARERVEQEARSARFVHGSITELLDGCFDLMYSNGVIHHVLRTQQIVNEMHRVLRPGGTALVMAASGSSRRRWPSASGGAGGGICGSRPRSERD